MEHLGAATASSSSAAASEAGDDDCGASEGGKRPRLPSVDDEHAAALSLREMAAPAEVRSTPRTAKAGPVPPILDGLAVLTAAIGSVPSPAGKSTPASLARGTTHNMRPTSFASECDSDLSSDLSFRKLSLPGGATIRPPAVPVTVNPPETPLDDHRRFSTDVTKAWPATAPWSPDAAVLQFQFAAAAAAAAAPTTVAKAPAREVGLGARVVSQAESEDDVPTAAAPPPAPAAQPRPQSTFPAPAAAPSPPKCEVLRLQQRVNTLEQLLVERDTFIQQLFAKTHVVETPSVTPRQHMGPVDAFVDGQSAKAAPEQPPATAARYAPIAPRIVVAPGATHVAAV